MNAQIPKHLTIVATIKAKANHVARVKSELLKLTQAS